MKLKNKIIGERIILRDSIKSDVAQSIEIVNDPTVMEYTFAGWTDKSVEERWAKLQEYFLDDETLFLSVEDKNNQEYLGHVSAEFDLKNDVVDFGITLRSDYHGKGYGTEAAKMIISYLFENYPKINRIQLCAFPENIGGIKCYEKAGFIKEGITREDLKFRGEHRDTIRMGILRSEFNK